MYTFFSNPFLTLARKVVSAFPKNCPLKLLSNCLVDGLSTSIVWIFKHSKRRHSLLQGQLEYVMLTFELTSPKVSISLRFLMQKKGFGCSRSGLFSFRLLLAPANCLEIVQQIKGFRCDCLNFWLFMKKGVMLKIWKSLAI